MFAICSRRRGRGGHRRRDRWRWRFSPPCPPASRSARSTDWLVAYGRIPSIVVTLAMLVALRDGLAVGDRRRLGHRSAARVSVVRIEPGVLIRWWPVALALGLCVAHGVGPARYRGRALAVCGRLECGSGAPGGHSRRARQGGDVRPRRSADGDRGGVERGALQPGSEQYRSRARDESRSPPSSSAGPR